MRHILLALLLSFLSACATQPVLKPADSEAAREKWQKRIQQFIPLDHWSIRGRIAILIEQDVHNAGLSWQREADRSTLKLESFLNLRSILLEKDDSGVRLTAADGEQYSGNNAQQLLYQVTGLVLPVDDLETWIKGLPHEGSEYEYSIDKRGRAINIHQDGWTINYLEYQNTPLGIHNNPELPRKLYLKHDDLAVKVVIDQWQNKALPANSELFPDFTPGVSQ